MQPPPLPGTQKISYQVPRHVLIGIWWRRMMLRPNRLIAIALLVIFSIVGFAVGGGMEYAGWVFVGLLIMMPISVYRVLVRAVENNKQLTDPKTVEFGATRIVVTGPDWKNEMAWTRFRGFSEDPGYFYLHLSDNGLASVVPKSAFSPEQEQIFREYARTRNA
jgi:hypothetical protein